MASRRRRSWPRVRRSAFVRRGSPRAGATQISCVPRSARNTEGSAAWLARANARALASSASSIGNTTTSRSIHVSRATIAADAPGAPVTLRSTGARRTALLGAGRTLGARGRSSACGGRRAGHRIACSSRRASNASAGRRAGSDSRRRRTNASWAGPSSGFCSLGSASCTVGSLSPNVIADGGSPVSSSRSTAPTP